MTAVYTALNVSFGEIFGYCAEMGCFPNTSAYVVSILRHHRTLWLFPKGFYASAIACIAGKAIHCAERSETLIKDRR